jgi:hypothetical protein
MYTKISNEIIRQFQPCYDPSKVITDENEELTVKQWVEKYRSIVPAKDILWLLSRKEFLSVKDLRLFAVWCAREALKFVENPDERSVNACNVAEKYANGEATKEELLAASDAVYTASEAAYAACDAAHADCDAAHTDFTDYTAAEAVYASLVAAHASDAEYADSAAANTAAAHAALAAAISARAAAHASDTVSCDDAAHGSDTAHAAQLDQLLTYFE